MATLSSSDPHPVPLTESEIYIRGFLAANPTLDTSLGPIQADEMMTERYTDAEWARMIAETQRVVLREVEEKERRTKVYPGPRMRDGKEALRQLAKTVDHTLLKLDAGQAAIDALCAEARTEGFKSVCVRLPWVARCVSNLKGSGVLVACVVGFHEGTQDTYSKLSEARAAVAAGAAELDIVLNHSILTAHNKSLPVHSVEPRRLVPTKKPETVLSSKDSAIDSITAANTAANARSSTATSTSTSTSTFTYSTTSDTTSGVSQPPPQPTDFPIPPQNTRKPPLDLAPEIPDYSLIYRELAALRSLTPSPTVLKLIFETASLTPPQILAAAHLAAAASFDYIKTSTGFAGRGASVEDVRLMVAAAEYLALERVGQRRMKVKASGGVRGLEGAVRMLELGAERLGTSSGVWIMQEARRRVDEERKRGAVGDVEEEMDGKGNGKEGTPGLTRLYTDDSVEGGY